ncbi:MAG: methyltransferase domain-containing protein [Myxococcota bacterium]
MPRRFPALLCLLCACLALGCGAWKRFGYEGFSRDGWQQPDQVLRLLEISPGDRVADIGAGGGYFSFRFADAVGAEGRVFAVDVDDDMLEYLTGRVADEGRTNVEVVRGAFEDPQLPDGEIDLVFLSNTYHHIQDRPDYFRGVLGDLSPRGRVAIVELDDRSWFPRTFGHYSEPDAIVREMEAAGYVRVADHAILERQSFQIFAPTKGG